MRLFSPQQKITYSMTIASVIAHRLIKSAPSSACEIKLRSETLPLNGKTEELCRELKNSFVRKAGKMYGCISDNSAEHPIKPLLLEYLEDKINFASLCAKLLTQLKLHIDQGETTIDSHVIFFFEKIEAGDAFYMILLDHDSGLYLDGELSLCDARFLDTTNLNLAAKIKIPELLQNQQQNYLSLLRWRGEKELSDAFAETVGFANQIDIAADTSQFLELVTHYTQDLPDDEAKETRQQVVEYCLDQDKSGHPVVFKELSQKISHNNKPAFEEYVSKVQPQVRAELIPDKTQLRNYVRISGRNEQLSMSFASACLGNTVVYDPETDSITIRDIPPGLKSKLVHHLKKQ